MSNLNNEVRLVATHLGLTGDLNDNGDFTSTLDSIMKDTKNVVVLEEYFNNVIYFMGDVNGTNYMYFTASVSDADEEDGFLIESENVNSLFKYLSKIRYPENRGYLGNGYMKELLEYAIEEGIQLNLNELLNENENEI